MTFIRKPDLSEEERADLSKLIDRLTRPMVRARLRELRREGSIAGEIFDERMLLDDILEKAFFTIDRDRYMAGHEFVTWISNLASTLVEDIVRPVGYDYPPRINAPGNRTASA